MKKVGIMGGTFNPIHRGHLAIARQALSQFALSQVLFIPNGVPYMKDLHEVLPASVRCEMTRLAIAGEPSFALSLIEAEKQENTYTCETLKSLREADPLADYYFIAGADSLWAMESWKNPEEIFRSCRILAAVRDHKSQEDMERQIASLHEAYGADIRLLQTPDMDVSSSMIRERVGCGESIKGLVPEAVEAYIMDHKLYQKNSCS